MSQKTFDTLVIGGGLSGLLVAQTLSRHGQEVGLLEASESLGGLIRPHLTQNIDLDYGLKFFSNNPQAHEALDFIEYSLNKKIARTAIGEPPVHFHKGQLQPFVGFGESAPDYADELSNYLTADRLALDFPVFNWPKLLLEKELATVFPRTQVSRFLIGSEAEIEKGQNLIKGVLVNGQQVLTATQYVFTADVADLVSLLPKGSLSAKAIKQVSAHSLWTSVSLDITHKKPVTSSNAVHVLYGSSEEKRACVGLFNPENESGQQVSQWLTLIPAEMTQDDDSVAFALREVKRQIKRAYPDAFNQVAHERILISPSSHGKSGIKLSENQTLPGFRNLWISSKGLQSSPNLVGVIAQAKQVLTKLLPNLEVVRPNPDFQLP
jgi:hypothetical protein